MDYDDRHIGPGKPDGQAKYVKRRSSSLRPAADAVSSLGGRHDSLALNEGVVGPRLEGMQYEPSTAPANGPASPVHSPHVQASSGQADAAAGDAGLA